MSFCDGGDCEILKRCFGNAAPRSLHRLAETSASFQTSTSTFLSTSPAWSIIFNVKVIVLSILLCIFAAGKNYQVMKVSERNTICLIVHIAAFLAIFIQIILYVCYYVPFSVPLHFFFWTVLAVSFFLMKFNWKYEHPDRE
jgi:hypothetical protein